MIYTFVTVFFIAVLSDTLQVRGLLQVYLRQYSSSERNLFRFLQSKDKFGSHTFCTDHINILVMCIDDSLTIESPSPVPLRSFPREASIL